jgi:hypothetical protein
MFTGLRILLFILPLCLFVPQVQAGLLMPLRVGEWGQYSIVDNSNNSWTGKISVTGTLTGGSQTYYIVLQQNWQAPIDKDRIKYMRSTEDTVYRYNQDTGEEFAYARNAAVGTNWRYIWNGITINVEILSILASVITPYGTFHNVIEQRQYNDSFYEYQYFAPGFGEIMSIDSRTTNAPMTRKLTASRVPQPFLPSILLLLLGSD